MVLTSRSSGGREEVVCVKVGDLGLAKYIKHDTGVCIVDGALVYHPVSAPEVLRENMFSEASDVYTLGMVMWQMFSGCAALPFAEVGTREELEEALWKEGDALRPPLGREWDRRVCDLIEECWKHEPGERPSLRAVVGRLRELKSSRYAPRAPVGESEGWSSSSSTGGDEDGARGHSRPYERDGR